MEPARIRIGRKIEVTLGEILVHVRVKIDRENHKIFPSIRFAKKSFTLPEYY